MENFIIKKQLIELFTITLLNSLKVQRNYGEHSILTEILITKIKEKELEIEFIFLDEKSFEYREESFMEKIQISNIDGSFGIGEEKALESILKNVFDDLCKNEELKVLNKINSVPIIYCNKKENENPDIIFNWIDYSRGTAKLLSEGKNMVGRDLSEISFDGSLGLREFADFTDINLEKALLRNVKIIYGTLNNTSFKNADMEGFEISQMHADSLISADMSGANLKNSVLNNLDLRKINLTGANIEGADLSYSNMAHKDFRGMNLRNVRFNKSNLNGADFRDTQLEEAKFYNCNLKGANFEGAILDKTEIHKCNLENCKFDRSSMKEISISQSKSFNSSFDSAKLEKCKTFSGELQNMDWSKKDFSGADMSCSDLRNTDLKSCKFKNSDLSYVNFSGAYLKNADFTMADLTGSIFISVEVDGARFDNAETEGMKIHVECAHRILELLDQEQKNKVIIID